MKKIAPLSREDENVVQNHVDSFKPVKKIELDVDPRCLLETFDRVHTELEDLLDKEGIMEEAVGSSSFEVRNAKGSLLCRLFYCKGVWDVSIKKKECYTFLSLHDNGTMTVTNSFFPQNNADNEYQISIPT